jgi:hypothetical protein
MSRKVDHPHTMPRPAAFDGGSHQDARTDRTPLVRRFSRLRAACRQRMLPSLPQH